MYEKIIRDYIKTSTDTVVMFQDDIKGITEAADIIIKAYRNDGKVIIFGNGGSAADSQHFATELVSRFRKDRAPLNAVALTTNSSMLTAIGNDIGFKDIFKRQIEAIARPDDAAVAISTSGNSENIVEAAAAAADVGLKLIAFIGADGGKLENYADAAIKPSTSVTSHIQECHLIAYHAPIVSTLPPE